MMSRRADHFKFSISFSVFRLDLLLPYNLAQNEVTRLIKSCIKSSCSSPASFITTISHSGNKSLI